MAVIFQHTSEHLPVGRMGAEVSLVVEARPNDNFARTSRKMLSLLTPDSPQLIIGNEDLDPGENSWLEQATHLKWILAAQKVNDSKQAQKVAQEWGKAFYHTNPDIDFQIVTNDWKIGAFSLFRKQYKNPHFNLIACEWLKDKAGVLFHEDILPPFSYTFFVDGCGLASAELMAAFILWWKQCGGNAFLKPHNFQGNVELATGRQKMCESNLWRIISEENKAKQIS